MQPAGVTGNTTRRLPAGQIPARGNKERRKRDDIYLDWSKSFVSGMGG